MERLLQPGKSLVGQVAQVAGRGRMDVLGTWRQATADNLALSNTPVAQALWSPCLLKPIPPQLTNRLCSDLETVFQM